MGFDLPLNDWIDQEHKDFIKKTNSYYDSSKAEESLSSSGLGFLKNRMIFT